MKKFFLSVLCLTLFVSAVFLASGCRQKTTHVHSFTNYVSDNNATTEKDGTKTAHCDYEGCSATDTITDEGSKLKNETFFKTLTVDGNKVYGKVSNDTQTFSFIDEIQTVGVTKYVVSLDVYGSQQVATKVVPLNVGDNLVYVIELSDGEPQTVYEVTIRRKPLYTVSFDTNGGTAVDSQVVEEDSIIPAPVTTKIGYTFINWNFDFSQPITENAIITAKFKVKDEMANFNFNSSVAECTITGVKDKTVSEIIIPDYVTSIGDSAFSYCSGTTSITIGNGVTSIGNYTFRDCTKLTRIMIPDSVISVGNYAFLNCSKLKSVTIGNGVTSIDFSTFLNCSRLESVSIGNRVTSIGINAFANCSSLVNITIPDGVTSIGGFAFRNCIGLTKVTIPDSLTSIGIYAFENCNSLTYNVYDNAYYLGNDTNKYVALVKAKDKIITSCNINENCKLIGDSAFRYCSKLTSITIPESVTSIGYSAFFYCGIESLNVANGNSIYHSQGNCVIKTATKTLVAGCKNSIIPNDDTVTSIGTHAFSGCTELTSITIPDNITSIDDYAFKDCNGLTSITIGKSVTYIGKDAFSSCKALTSITIPDNVTYIGDAAFTDCPKLTSVTIGAGVTYITKSVFFSCSNLETLTVSIGNSIYHSQDNCIIETTTKTLIIGCKNSIIPNDGTVTSIGNSAFSQCYGLTSITIPDSVTSIGNSAFGGCSSLTSVTIGNGVTSIGNSAFSECSGLTGVTIGNSVTSIDDYAFYGCNALTNVTIPDSITYISHFAFYHCNSLIYNEYGDAYYLGNDTNKYVALIKAKAGITSCYINDNCKFICTYAFKPCSNLASITIPAGVISIGDGAFAACIGLESIEVAKGNSIYHSEGNCVIKTATKTLVVGCKNSIIPNDGSVTSIGDYAFHNCNGLISITIPDCITSIGDSAFLYCLGLKSITIGNGVTYIGNSTFGECGRLKTIFYKGTEEQWDKISIGSGNNFLINANIHYSESESTHN